ncbi:alpha/beta fold hydrolase [Sorangium sp. So ce1335]|uniref:alpha/beta fold hydrolase n=1 Tax=Sorangium sp. So ce1335 TaxID=3133335 RepID=UPI003F606449
MRCKVKDLEIEVEVIGSGTPILMLHGWGPDHRLMKGCMEPVFRSAPGRWRRVYFDLPGMGRTPGRPWIDGSDGMLEVVLGLVDQVLPGERFLVAGESYGGYLARGVVHERPQSVAGLLLVCPVAVEETREANAPPLRVLERDEAFLATLSDDDRRAFASIHVRQVPAVWERFRDEILPGLRAADTAFLERNLGPKVTFSFAVDALEPPFPGPTLMLAGRQDSVVGYRDLWGILEAYPRASFVLLDRAGHNLQTEQPALFEAAVTEWLERVAGTRAHP